MRYEVDSGQTMLRLVVPELHLTVVLRRHAGTTFVLVFAKAEAGDVSTQLVQRDRSMLLGRPEVAPGARNQAASVNTLPPAFDPQADDPSAPSSSALSDSARADRGRPAGAPEVAQEAPNEEESVETRTPPVRLQAERPSASLVQQLAWRLGARARALRHRWGAHTPAHAQEDTHEHTST